MYDGSFQVAISSGDLEECRRLIALGANPRFEGDTAIRRAVSTGNVTAARFLFRECGVDVHALGGILLDLAVESRSLEMCELVLDEGICPDANSGRALVLAIHDKNPDMCLFLLRRGCRPSDEALLLAYMHTSEECIKHLIDYGADASALMMEVDGTVVCNSCLLSVCTPEQIRQAKEDFVIRKIHKM